LDDPPHFDPITLGVMLSGLLVKSFLKGLADRAHERSEAAGARAFDRLEARLADVFRGSSKPSAEDVAASASEAAAATRRAGEDERQTAAGETEEALVRGFEAQGMPPVKARVSLRGCEPKRSHWLRRRRRTPSRPTRKCRQVLSSVLRQRHRRRGSRYGVGQLIAAISRGMSSEPPDADGEAGSAVEQVRSLELQLLDPAMRRDRAAVERLLHPDFVEIGASGRVWDGHSVLDSLGADTRSAPVVSELQAKWLSPDAILVIYRAQRPTGTASVRASVWLRDAHGWRVRFHQGTPVTSSESETTD
jgi:ribonuclease HI